MKLHPYPNLELRWCKVCKHVFDHTERWWEIYGDLVRWQRDWTVLRATGCFHDERRHLVIKGHPAAEAVAREHHDQWLAAAERATDEARHAGRVHAGASPDRLNYHGDQGIKVVVARGNYLVTCFRPGLGTRRPADAAVQHKVAARAAVRRDHRRASLQPKGARRPGEEHDDAS